ncbi:MAG: hypothetical protein JO069_02735, partial [Verrucomicrobia bacterium]|nr:hypothetical protein [Verrucomicrobiota bacterium]
QGIATQRDSLEAQLKESEAKVQAAQQSVELATGQRYALGAQLKAAQERTDALERDTRDLAGQRDALQARLRDSEAKAQAAQEGLELAASQRQELEKRSDELTSNVQQLQQNAELAAGERNALEVQLRTTEERAEAAEKAAQVAAGQRDALRSELNEREAQAQAARTSADAGLAQREALEKQLTATEARAQVSQRAADQASRERDALRAQLKDAEMKAQGAEKTAELASSQRDALQARVRELEETAKTKPQDAGVANVQQNRPPDQGSPYRNSGLTPVSAASKQIQPPNPSPSSGPLLPGQRREQPSTRPLGPAGAKPSPEAGRPPRTTPGSPSAKNEGMSPEGVERRLGVGPSAPAAVNGSTASKPATRPNVPVKLLSPVPSPLPTEPPAVAAALPSRGLQIDQHADEPRLHAFVREYIQSVANNNIAAQAHFFAGQVNFYGRGVLGRDQVQSTTQRYHEEWPVRRWTADGKPKITAATGPGSNRYEILQPFRWTVSDGVRKNEGSATLHFVVQEDAGGEFRIVSVRQLNR